MSKRSEPPVCPSGFFVPPVPSASRSVVMPHLNRPSHVAPPSVANSGWASQPCRYTYATAPHPQRQQHGQSKHPSHQQPNQHNDNSFRQYHQTINVARSSPFAPPPPRQQFRPPSMHADEASYKSPAQIWTCQPCNLSLDSQTALQAHQASHITCTACSFQAAPKVVKGHFQAVHGKFAGSGFKTVTIAVPGCSVQRFRICVGNRPEDIQQWIADRRKRFPRTMTQPKIYKSDPTLSAERPIIQSFVPESLITKMPKTSENENKGISALLDGYGSSSDESENDNHEDSTHVVELADDVPTSRAVPDPPEVQLTTSLIEQSQPEMQLTTALETDGPNIETEHVAEAPSRNSKSRVCRYFARNGSCRNGNACHFSHDLSISKTLQQPINSAGVEGILSSERRHSPPRKKTKREPTLLEKLLAHDIQREKQITLKMLEYIYHTNFLRNSNESRSSIGDLRSKLTIRRSSS